MANKPWYRYEFNWVDSFSNYEITKCVAASTKKEAVRSFKEQRENAGLSIPKDYTVKKTFIIVY